MTAPLAGAAAYARGDSFGMQALWQTLRQQRRPALATFAVVLTATVLYGWLAAPVYRADTLVQLSPRPRATLLPTLDDGARSGDAERREAGGEIEVLRSRDILLPAIEAVGADVTLGGARRWGFVPVGARHGIAQLRLRLPEAARGSDFTLSVTGGTWELRDEDDRVVRGGPSGQEVAFSLRGQPAMIRVDLEPQAPDVRVVVQQQLALKAYERVVDRLRLFEPGRETAVVRLSYEDSDPDRAAALLNALVAGYLKQAVDRRAEEGRQALAYLDSQLPFLETRLREAEDALATYQRTHASVPVGSEADALLRQRGDLERQVSELQVKRAQLAQTLMPEHPEMAGVNAQLASLRAAIARTGVGTAALPTQQRDLSRLQRDVQLAAQQYGALLDRAQQLRIAASSWLPGARQLDKASAPVEPLRPRWPALLSIGLGLATVLALATALLMRALRGRISDVFEIESALQPATVASIPQSSNQPRLMDGRLDEAVETDMGTHRLLARAAPQDPAIESLRSVQLSLMLRARSIQAQVVLVTSPSYGAGKSFVASNLAALMAESGKRVLLIEADMRRPAIYRYVGLDPYASGLSEVLCGLRTLDQVIYPHASANLDTVMQGMATDNPGSLLLLPSLAAMLDTLRERYDHIVIHTPPLMVVGDTLAFGRVADCALLVVRSEQSLLDEANEAARRLERAGIRLEGVIFNGVRPARHGGLAQI